MSARRPATAKTGDRAAGGRDGALLRRVESVGFAVFVGFLVLAFTTSFPNQFALPKLLGLSLYAVFAAACWAAAAKQGRVVALPRWLALIVAASALWWVATTITAQHVPTAIAGVRGRHNGLATMLAGLAIFVFLATTRATRDDVRRRVGVVGAALTVASGYALVQAAGLDPIPWPEGRPASTLGHPVILAGALALELPFAVAFALTAVSRAARFAWIGVTLVQALALAVTLARGPWIAAACGLVALAGLAASRQRGLLRRLAAVAAAALLATAAMLIASRPTREAVVDRVATFGDLAADSSVGYRLHFYRTALAMLRDHPVTGVGWENFGLLYPRYRPQRADSIEIVPSMVHSGPLQTAVSGGLPALALEIALLAGVAAAVARRRGREDDARSRILGAAFLASLIAYFVQNLSGWPHVALGALAFVVWGLAVCWSREPRVETLITSKWPLYLLAASIGIGGVWLAIDTARRMRAERLIYEAQALDVRQDWADIERKLQHAIETGPDRAWVNDAAGRLYARRAAAANDRDAYRRGAALFDAALRGNPFDPYVRLRRAEHDRVAVDHGLIAGISEGGRDAMRSVTEMTPGSALTRRVEESIARRTGGSRIDWLEPQESAGFGPPGSLVIAGTSPKTLPGTRVVLHWRNRTRGSEWVTSPYSAETDERGVWYNAIPDARLGERYEVYSSSETRPIARCEYRGSGASSPCSPLAAIWPAPGEPLGTLIAGGAVLDEWREKTVYLRWRNASRQSAWKQLSFRTGQSSVAVTFPPDAPGTWYARVPDLDLAEAWEFHLSSSPAVYGACTYDGHGARRECGPISWIAPRDRSGFGPPGSLVVAGSMAGAPAAAPVFLHWRNATRGSAWTTEPYAPMPDARGTWFNFIPRSDPAERYQVFTTSPLTASEPCTYAGDGARTLCR